jgi:hypothetical protein
MRLADKALPNEHQQAEERQEPAVESRGAGNYGAPSLFPERISETLIHGTPGQVSGDSSKG